MMLLLVMIILLMLVQLLLLIALLRRHKERRRCSTILMAVRRRRKKAGRYRKLMGSSERVCFVDDERQNEEEGEDTVLVPLERPSSEGRRWRRCVVEVTMGLRTMQLSLMRPSIFETIYSMATAFFRTSWSRARNREKPLLAMAMRRRRNGRNSVKRRHHHRSICRLARQATQLEVHEYRKAGGIFVSGSFLQ